MRRALRGSACFVRRMRSSCPVPKFFPCKAELSMRPKRGDNRGKPVKFVPFTSALCWMLGKRIVCLRPPALRQNNGAALGAAPLKRANLRQMRERGIGKPAVARLSAMPMQLPQSTPFMAMFSWATAPKLAVYFRSHPGQYRKGQVAAYAAQFHFP